MMLLTEQQTDALTEVINIGFSRAAAALSDITGQRVLLEVPKVDILPIADLQKSLGAFVDEEIATVHQIFNGSVSGDAMLMLNYQGAVHLSRLLTDAGTGTERLYESDREVLTEVGNILLNACLGTFGNMLKVQIAFAVPRLHLEELGALLDTLIIGKDEIQYALVVYTHFRIRESDINGFLVIVLGVNSLDLLLKGLEELA